MTHRRHLSLLSMLTAWLFLTPLVVGAQTPDASPVAEGAGWRISAVRETAPDARGEALSPDGRWVAGWNRGGDGAMCVWAVATGEPTCSAEALPDGFLLVPGVFVWAPDSTAVAFASVPRASSALDSDIYVYELAANRLVNLTDDGYEGSAFDFPHGIPLDAAPAWSPDSRQLAFSRLLPDATGLWESLMRIDRSGGEPVELIPLGSVWPLEVAASMVWLPDDSLLYTRRNVLVPEDPRNGLWRGIPAGVQGAVEGRTVQLVTGAADGDMPYPEIHDVQLERGLVSLFSVTRFVDDPSVRPGRIFWLYDVEQEALRSLPALEIDGRLATPARPAILSPDGAMALVLYAIDEAPHLVVLELATGAFHVLDHPPDLAPVGPGRRWTANDLVLVSSGEGGTVRTVMHLERPVEATPAP